MRNKQLIFAFLFSTLSFGVQAQHEVIKIWPKLAPGSENIENKEQLKSNKSVTNVYQPDLTVFVTKHQSELTPAIIICPGGGYNQVVMAKEGYKIAKWFNENGITAFVLKYRLNRETALRDAQRAMSLIRSDAAKYNIDKNKIGVIGFSSGAHLAGNLSSNYLHKDNYDSIDNESSRPDFMIGIYSSYQGIKAHENFPPTFLVHAINDPKAPVEGCVELFKNLNKNMVPVEMHIYEHGGHGFALETDKGEATTSTVKDWSSRCIEWMKLKGIL
ncbi:alpha/beta hydrolase [uncultured Draconibacterium sp.]|uniref:alpha/beta hydrolase n=1 Tax=uncultured Draconibacterium sp. TaxID=1573823 RepID=UPI0025DFC5E7|nr:alpha/beta hydrolase [uncultured Draconibacterium sp.]